MRNYSYRTGAALISFGRGTFEQLPQIVEECGAVQALVLSTEFQRPIAETAVSQLGGAAAGVFSGAVMHTPVDVTDTALAYCESIGADSIVSIGGGSTIGLGKALSHRTGLPHIVVPTTYAGSEVTDILGQTEGGLKTTARSGSILPMAVIYDPTLTDGLPLQMSIVSGLNAMAHAAEALYAQDRNPISSMLAVEGFGAMKNGLGLIFEDERSVEGRDAALYGAWLCGTVLGQVGMALHHKICHTLGGSFNMPHAETHAVMLPHTIGFNSKSVPDLLAPIGDVFGKSPGAGLFSFAKNLGSPMSLKELGFNKCELDRAAEIAAANPYWNPRPIDQSGLRAILQDAFDGMMPPDPSR
jgi:maleylacetate reductase